MIESHRGMRNGVTTPRDALAGLATTTAMTAGLAGMRHRSRSAQDATLRWWSPQGAPAQVEAYAAQIASFEAANPGIKVQPSRRPRMKVMRHNWRRPFHRARFRISSRICPPFAVQSYYANGLLEPFNDVINAVGADDLLSTALTTSIVAADGKLLRHRHRQFGPPICFGCVVI